MDAVHINTVKALLKKGSEFIDQATELLDTKIIVGDISVPKKAETQEAPKPKRQYRKKQKPDESGEPTAQ
jgi:hypothetical protein